MIAFTEIAEARATAQVLRATARALRGEKGSLRFRLFRAAEALYNVIVLAVRLLKRIDQLEWLFTGSGKDGAP